MNSTYKGMIMSIIRESRDNIKDSIDSGQYTISMVFRMGIILESIENMLYKAYFEYGDMSVNGYKLCVSWFMRFKYYVESNLEKMEDQRG